MSRTLFLFALLLAPSIAWAQPSTPDTLKTAHGWIRDLGLQLAGSQAQYQNWQEGGIDALAVSARTASKSRSTRCTSTVACRCQCAET